LRASSIRFWLNWRDGGIEGGRRLREGFQVEQLPPHHHEVAPGQECARRTAPWPGRRHHAQLCEEPRAIRRLGARPVGDAHEAEQARALRVDRGRERHLHARLEILELEDLHEALAALEPFELRDQRARAAAAAVVDPVVAVWRDAELAEPSKHDSVWRGDVDPAPEPIGTGVLRPISRKGQGAFGGRGAPVAGDHPMSR